MQIILLPGMDGTGILFESLLKELSKDIEVQIISYPCDKNHPFQGEELITWFNSLK